MSDENPTKSTIETILERMQIMEEERLTERIETFRSQSVPDGDDGTSVLPNSKGGIRPRCP